MASKNKYGTKILEEENLKILVDLLVDPQTPPSTQIKIMARLVEQSTPEDFFDIMLKEALDVGRCPNCDHSNHWLIPEAELNKRGIVTSEEDSRVAAFPTAKDCPEFEQACPKKKTGF